MYNRLSRFQHLVSTVLASYRQHCACGQGHLQVANLRRPQPEIVTEGLEQVPIGSLYCYCQRVARKMLLQKAQSSRCLECE